MKLIIAGSRHLNVSIEDLVDILHKFGILSQISEVVSGCAEGIDSNGELFAFTRGIDIKQFPANWDKYGKSAGPRRNLKMAEYGDALLLIWDGKSKGSANMKARMKGMKKTIYEVIVENQCASFVQIG